MRVGQILDGFMIVVSTAQRDLLLSGPADNINGIHYKTTLPQLHV